MSTTTTNNNSNNNHLKRSSTSNSALSTGSQQQKQVPFRSLAPPDTGDSNHFLPALQVIAHVLIPLRKALIHFHFLCKQNPDVAKSKIEYQVLSTLGQIFQAMMAPIPPPDANGAAAAAAKKKPPSSDSDSDDDDDSDDSSVKLPPIDPTPFYTVLVPCLVKFEKSTSPKDATQALQILLEVLQGCCRQIPVTSHLWSALIDQAGTGVVAKQSIVGQCELEEDGEILQRTTKESIILWCPWKLPLMPTLPLALQKACAKRPMSAKDSYDFDTKPYDFEVRIPLWNKSSSSGSSLSGNSSVDDSSTWKTTKSIQLTSLTTFLFLAIDRFENNNNNNNNNNDKDDADTINPAEVEIPKLLDVSKLCASNTRTSASSQKSTSSRQYELVAGILVDDEEDYVAILKNFAVSDPEDEEAWKLMETEEVIPMTESDVLDFLKGEGEEGGPCGTVLVYQRCDDGQSSTVEMNQILSDIIISHVSGTLDASPDYYYEEEVIEDGDE